jgi:hypothetical protein
MLSKRLTLALLHPAAPVHRRNGIRYLASRWDLLWPRHPERALARYNSRGCAGVGNRR